MSTAGTAFEFGQSLAVMSIWHRQPQSLTFVPPVGNHTFALLELCHQTPIAKDSDIVLGCFERAIHPNQLVGVYGKTEFIFQAVLVVLLRIVFRVNRKCRMLCYRTISLQINSVNCHDENFRPWVIKSLWPFDDLVLEKADAFNPQPKLCPLEKLLTTSKT